MSASVGIGYDSHRFEAGRPLILGGVEIPHEQRPRRATPTPTCVTHAVIDALLGATGAGDIGDRYPPERRALARS